jgi:EF hand
MPASNGTLIKLAATAVLALTGFGATQVLASDDKQDFATHFMTSWDADSDGKVTVDEARERRESIFLSFDNNEDGKLGDDELAMMDEMRASQHENMEGGGHGKGMGKGMKQGMGHGKGMGHGNSGGMGRFQQAAESGLHDRKGIDANGDGTITKDEFVGMTEAWFARLDGNGDGVITTVDL